MGSGSDGKKSASNAGVEGMRVLFLIFAPVIWVLILTVLFVVYILDFLVGDL